MSEILADSKYSPAAVVGGRRVSFSRRHPHAKADSPPVSNQPEPSEPQDYPRPPPPPTFAAEHGLPIEIRTDHKSPYVAPPHGRGAISTSPKASFMHLHKSEMGHR